MNDLPSGIPIPTVRMQEFNNMLTTMRHVFKYLNIQDLLTASRVCTAWNVIAMYNGLWRNVRLKNAMVYDWEKCIDFVISKSTVSFDTRRMLIPMSDNEHFWLSFIQAIKRANQLKTIELYRCPTRVVELIIHFLPQLEVLNATIKHLAANDGKLIDDYLTLDLGYLHRMTQLTELRLIGLSAGIKLLPLPSFKHLTNLKSLSLTSIQSFPKDMCCSLFTLTKSLEFLEIGNCDGLSKDFALVLERLVNLKSLRLENCIGEWKNHAVAVFHSISKLKNLKVLELINIELSYSIENELQKCDHIKALLVIPDYGCKLPLAMKFRLFGHFEKLSKSLTHLVWGITNESIHANDLIFQTLDNLPKKRKSTSETNEVNILNIVQVLKKLLETIFTSAKIKVVKIPYSVITRVYLADQFNEFKNVKIN